MKVKSLLEQYNLRPSKSLGQTFLQDEGIAQRIVSSAELSPTDDVLEVGPGLGILTRLAAAQANRVVAVEVDRLLAHILAETLDRCPNVELVNDDILQVDLEALLGEAADYVVISNLPYSITSAAIRRLLECSRRPRLLVLMVQGEVAERILAAPGKMNLLALSVQYYGQPSMAFMVPRGAFYPVPGVDSAVLTVRPHSASPLTPDDTALFFTIARAAFAQKRKQILNSLTAGLGISKERLRDALEECDVDPRRRPQTLSMAEWRLLRKVIGGLVGDIGSDRAPLVD